jgi:flavorubredoxin
MKARAPHSHHAPLRIAEDTYLIRQLHGEGEAPVGVYMNSMVITGEQPAIIDTGTPSNRDAWIDDVFSLVDPADVRWIFLSHDDVDHVGNLEEVLALAPQARLVSTFFMGERMSCDIDPELGRTLWVNDGESVDLGDRTIVAVRPPVFDSPVTRGFYDTKTGVYWASDSFAAPVLAPSDDVGDLDPTFWADGFHQFQAMVSPWLFDLRHDRWLDRVNAVARLRPATIAACHTPVITGRQVDTALRLMRDVHALGPVQDPTQADLEEMLAQVALAAL